MYNIIVRDCFFNPRHVGTIERSLTRTVFYDSIAAQSGALVHLAMHCDIQKCITRMCFQTNGNPYLIASLEWLCREVIRSTLEKGPIINYQRLIEVLAIPKNQSSVAVQVEHAYKEIVALMQRKFEEQHE
jgi:nitrogen fixation NifU-like protein